MQKSTPLSEFDAVLDGLLLYLEQNGYCVIHEMFRNVYINGNYLSNVFSFETRGNINCSVNASCSIHDFSITKWGGVHDKVEEGYEAHGVKVIVDSAFARRKFPFLIKSEQGFVGAAKGSE